MPRPPAGDAAHPPLSPYQTPPSGLPSPLTSAAPFSYAGQPIPPAPNAKASPTPAGLFNAFRRRWVLGTFVGVLCAVGVAAAVWLVMPGGKHEARGLIELRKLNGAEPYKINEDYESYRRQQMFRLKTREMLSRTVNDPTVNSLGMIRALPVDERERAIEEALTVSVAAPAVLAVVLKGNDLEEMKTIVDSHMKRFIEDAAEIDRRDRADQMTKLKQTERKLKDELEAFDRQQRLLGGSLGGSGPMTREMRQAELTKRLSTLQAEIDQMRKQIDKADTDRKVAQQQLTAGHPPIDSEGLNLLLERDTALRPLQAAKELAAEKLAKAVKTATDPDTDDVVAEAKAGLKKAEENYAAKRKVVSAELEAIERTKATLQLKGKVAELDTRIAGDTLYQEKLKLDYDTLSKSLSGDIERTFDREKLLEDSTAHRNMIAQVRDQLVKLQAASDLENRAKILEFAQSMPNTNQNRKLILSGVAGFGTFGIVVLLVAFLEWRTRRVDSVDQVVTELGMRILGTVPVFPNRASLQSATEVGGANWRFALNESINSTRTLLLHTAKSQSMQVVMVTSATQGEGKTSLASQLASSMATTGMRTLIVDCDLRNPSIHKLFDLALTNGVSEILTQEVDVADAVQPTVVPNLWVISAGQCSNRVISSLAQGHPLETLFNRLRGQFDFIIVDSCPVLPVADALLVGQHVDGVLFSIMQDISQLPKVLLASEKLTALGIPLMGAVVNGIKQDVYSYGYNYVKQLPA